MTDPGHGGPGPSAPPEPFGSDTLCEALPVPTLLLNAERRVVRANQRALALLGEPQAGIPGPLMEVLDGPEPASDLTVDLVVATPRGDRTVHLLVSSARIDHAGEPMLLVTLQDVSERQRSQRDLRVSEARWRSLAESTPDHVVLLDTRFRVLYINRDGPNSSVQDLIGRNITEFLPASEVDTVSRAMRGVLADRRPARWETYIDTDDGPVHFETRAAPRFVDGQLAGLTLLSRDITERKTLRAELDERRQRLRNLIDATEDVLMLMDPDGRVLECNESLARAYGIPRDQLLGAAALGPLDPEDAARRRRVAELVKATGEPQRIQDSRGGRHFDSTVYPVNDEDGTLRQLVVHARDVTQLMELQTRLAEADRLSSIGLLAAGVAHEINNPLAYILLSLQEIGAVLASDEEGLQPELAGLLQDATTGVLRVRDIVRDLGTFAKDGGDALGPVDLEQVVRRALDMAGAQTRFKARTETDLQLRELVSDGPRLTQVLINLLVNASHAIQDGDATRNLIRISSHQDAGQAVITVSDTGAGIEPELLSRLFEPFFTTRKLGVGTGLGLSICHNIVTSLGGTIKVESELGWGSRFILRLPLTRTTGDIRPDPPAPGPGPSARRGRVLIVDDEPALGRTLDRLVSRHHDTVVCTSGREAMAILERDPAFDAILCDLIMPELTGVDLHTWVREHRPALEPRMIFMTGGAFTPRTERFIAESEAAVLSKPFDPDELLGALATCIDGR